VPEPPTIETDVQQQIELASVLTGEMETYGHGGDPWTYLDLLDALACAGLMLAPAAPAHGSVQVTVTRRAHAVALSDG
jgi:hypothetical protein